MRSALPTLLALLTCAGESVARVAPELDQAWRDYLNNDTTVAPG